MSFFYYARAEVKDSFAIKKWQHIQHLVKS